MNMKPGNFADAEVTSHRSQWKKPSRSPCLWIPESMKDFKMSTVDRFNAKHCRDNHSSQNPESMADFQKSSKLESPSRNTVSITNQHETWKERQSFGIHQVSWGKTRKVRQIFRRGHCQSQCKLWQIFRSHQSPITMRKTFSITTIYDTRIVWQILICWQSTDSMQNKVVITIHHRTRKVSHIFRSPG
jgi:hypothetical protein